MAISPRFAMRTEVRAAEGFGEEVVEVERRRGSTWVRCLTGRRLLRIERIFV
jgi:hypothetical protein